MCDNTLMVADKCDPFEVDTSPKIPEIANADDQLRILVAKSLRDRGLNKKDRRFVIDGKEVTYVEQAKIELNRFIDKGFASYFLITISLKIKPDAYPDDGTGYKYFLLKALCGSLFQ